MVHKHDHNQANRNIATVFALNAFFVVVELVGGLLTNSVAILSDALHDFGDCLSLAISWGFQKKATKKRDLHYSYGYRRFSLLGAIFLSGVLFVSSILILIEAAQRIANPQLVDAEKMLWIAIFGVVINGAAALKLKKGASLNERAVFLHILEDVLGWVAVLVVSIVLQFYNVPILDPILSIAISIWVLSNVYKNSKAVFKILLQAIPDTVDMAELTKQLTAISGVESIHDLHVWSLDGEWHVASLHVVAPQAKSIELKNQLREVALHFQIKHITIEMEEAQEDCSYK